MSLEANNMNANPPQSLQSLEEALHFQNQVIPRTKSFGQQSGATEIG